MDWYIPVFENFNIHQQIVKHQLSAFVFKAKGYTLCSKMKLKMMGYLEI